MATINRVRTRAKNAVAKLSQQSLGGVTNGLRKVALAGVGAVAVAQDEVRTRVKSRVKSLGGNLDKLAERGDEAQKHGRQVVREFIKERAQGVKTGAEQITGKLEHQVASVLGKLNVPTKSDIVELTRRIDSLSRKIDKI